MTTAEFLSLVNDLKTLYAARHWRIAIHPTGDEPVKYTERYMMRKLPLVIRFDYPLKEIR